MKLFKWLFKPKQKCTNCGSTGLVTGYWSRGHDSLFGGAIGGRGTRCYDCGHIVFDQDKEAFEKTLPGDHFIVHR